MKEELHEITSSEQSTKFNELFQYISVAKGEEKLAATKGVIRRCKRKKERQHIGQKEKDKQPFTKHNTNN
jgi:hypothetical protein